MFQQGRSRPLGRRKSAARLDVVINEDHDRSRLGNGPHNLAVLRHMAMNVMQKDGEKGSLRGKIKRAGWDEAYLARLLILF
jgi:adenylosuccinate synthase